MEIITIRLPDPGAMSHEDRAYLKAVVADAIREVRGMTEDVGVDILPQRRS